MAKKKYNITRKLLIKKYIKNKISLHRIASELDCSHKVILYWMKKYNIPRRNLHQKKWDKILTKEFLYEQYIKNSKIPSKIAMEKNCSITTVFKYLKIHEIPIRSLSESKKDKLNHNYKDGKTKQIYYCIECGNKICYDSACFGLGRCGACAKKGENSPHWNNGSSFEPYPIEFTERLKKEIRKRDKYSCQLCSIKQSEIKKSLCIHHIDYNKNNLNFNNLISLCLSCHGKTNINRKFWKKYFKYLVNNKNPTREEAIKLILYTLKKDTLLISSLGMTSRTIYKILDSDKNLYLLGGMGSCLSIGIGIAKNTKKKIVVITGDGETLMGLNSLITHKKLNPKNLHHYILDNNTHASTGGQQTASNYCDFKSLAPNTIVIKIEKGKGNAPRIPLTGKQIKERFMRAINE